MKNILTLLLIITSFVPFAQEKVIFNDEHVVLRDVPDFHSVVVRGPFKVYYSSDPKIQVAVSAKDIDTRDRITSKVSNGTLYIGLEDNGIKWWIGNREFKVYITAPSINALNASGAVNIIVVDILKSNNLSLNLSGASDFSGKIDCTDFKANLSGASDSKISGEAEKISLVCTGASSFKASELHVNEADLVATGASNIKLTIRNSMKARASGASSIQFYGNPQKNNYASGASTIKNIDN
jgi:hypothetical protein